MPDKGHWDLAQESDWIAPELMSKTLEPVAHILGAEVQHPAACI
jgi:hypothetical protein